MISTYSPVDLSGVSIGTKVTVGGRLVEIVGSTLTLADAFGSCSVQLASEPIEVPTLGSWLQVHGVLERRTTTPELQQAAIVEQSSGQLPHDGYFARFTRVGTWVQARAVAAAATRAYFDAARFVEVSTPVRVAAPGTDVYLEPQPSEERWLITSPEFHHKRLLAGGFPRIYELAHCTRKGERGPWHHAEFTMLEWYAAFATVEQTMVQTEALVEHLSRALGIGSTIMVQGREICLIRPFMRLTVAQAYQKYAGIDDVATLAAEDEDTYFQVMVDTIDPAIAQIPVPVFLTHYPTSQAALAQQSPAHPGFAERFELFIGGVELCNGYGELTDAQEQAERFALDVERRANKGLPPLPVDDGLLQALREGVPPCSGNAVGFERLVCVLLGQTLDDVVAFPP